MVRSLFHLFIFLSFFLFSISLFPSLVTPEMKMSAVIETIVKNNFHRVYVIDEVAHELVSILTITDILNELMQTR
jgi:CBS domain-containing protein